MEDADEVPETLGEVAAAEETVPLDLGELAAEVLDIEADARVITLVIVGKHAGSISPELSLSAASARISSSVTAAMPLLILR